MSTRSRATLDEPLRNRPQLLGDFSMRRTILSLVLSAGVMMGASSGAAAQTGSDELRESQPGTTNQGQTNQGTRKQEAMGQSGSQTTGNQNGGAQTAGSQGAGPGDILGAPGSGVPLIIPVDAQAPIVSPPELAGLFGGPSLPTPGQSGAQTAPSGAPAGAPQVFTDVGPQPIGPNGQILGIPENLLIDANGTVLALTYAPDLRRAVESFNGQFGGTTGRFNGAFQKGLQDGPRPGTVPYGAFLTSDINGQPSIVFVDFNFLRGTEQDIGFFTNIEEQESVQFQMTLQPEGSFLARGYGEMAKGSMVNNTDWGISEGYTTRDGSINARVDNGPDDDEAHRQGNKFDESGRRVDTDE